MYKGETTAIAGTFGRVLSGPHKTGLALYEEGGEMRGEQTKRSGRLRVDKRARLKKWLSYIGKGSSAQHWRRLG